ncbi:hypothetical protein I6F07_23460 [Ensifer sp. IC4062]|nr:hypothetical protein [Ensifer sp. IC4062]
MSGRQVAGSGNRLPSKHCWTRRAASDRFDIERRRDRFRINLTPTHPDFEKPPFHGMASIPSVCSFRRARYRGHADTFRVTAGLINLPKIVLQVGLFDGKSQRIGGRAPDKLVVGLV